MHENNMDLHVHLVADAIDTGYWEQFNGLTVQKLHAMGILELIKVDRDTHPGVTAHYYRKA